MLELVPKLLRNAVYLVTWLLSLMHCEPPIRLEPDLQLRQFNLEEVQVAHKPPHSCTLPVLAAEMSRIRKYPSLALVQKVGELQAAQPVMLQAMQPVPGLT